MSHYENYDDDYDGIDTHLQKKNKIKDMVFFVI